MAENKEFIDFLINISTLSTVVFSFIKGFGITKQGIDIWKKKSGENVSPTFFFYNFFYFLIFLMYGVEENDVAIIVNGSLVFLYLPILLGLKKYRGFSKKEIGLIAIMGLIVPTSLVIDKDQAIIIFSLAAVIAIFSQAKEVWNTKSFGTFSVRYLQTFLVATIFWGIYYALTKNWRLFGLNTAESVIFAIALILEKKWRPKKE